MKILDREQFMNLPDGVLYAKLYSYEFGEISIKRESLTNDWVVHELFNVHSEDFIKTVQIIDEAIKKQIRFDLDFESTIRDGCFDENQMFAVFEAEEVQNIIKLLQGLTANYPSLDDVKLT